MKKVVAMLVVFVFIVGCVAAFAETPTKATQTPGEKVGTMIKKFFTDLGNLITRKIPETPEQRSSKQPWDTREPSTQKSSY
ncbi:MAG: hypothetical protein WBD24_05415 [Candidatus Omnitrophota bacterium]